jgi:fructokinase
MLYSHGESSEHPGYATDMVDSIGAGDSFTAALVLGRLAGWPLEEINARANRVAAEVCRHAGAMPTIRNGLKRYLAELDSGLFNDLEP